MSEQRRSVSGKRRTEGEVQIFEGEDVWKLQTAVYSSDGSMGEREMTRRVNVRRRPVSNSMRHGRHGRCPTKGNDEEGREGDELRQRRG